jgi:acetolactate synthase-1/2/3 large subunit
MLEAVRRWADRQLVPMMPQLAYLQALRRAIPEDGVLVADLTQVGYLATVAYPVWQPRTWLSAGYQGTLGYAFPTALGAAAALPGRTVVSISGDGGFGWALQELSTARKYGLGLIAVVFNDGQFGNVRLLQQQTFGHPFGTDLCNPDFAKLADAFGIASARADGPDALERAILEARARGGPSLIEVPVGPMPSAWPLLRLNSPFRSTVPEPPDPIAAFEQAARARG